MFPPTFSPPAFPGLFLTPEPRHSFLRARMPGPDIVPIGAIIAFPGEILQQTGQLTQAMTDLRYLPWMICDGSALLITEYPDLYRVIGTLYGSAGEGTYKLPDYRGYFLRAADPQRTLDRDERAPPPGLAVDQRGVGSTQQDAIQDHQHGLKMAASPVPSVAEATQPLVSPNQSSQTENVVRDGTARVSDTETRSINISVNWLIKTQ